MSPERMIVRPAAAEDGPSILDLIRQLGYDVDTNRYLPLLRVLLHRDSHCMLVAEMDRAVVGFVNVHFRVFFRYGDLVATVDELCVDEGHRDQGIGAELMGTVIAICRQRGAHHIELTTNKRREAALRFYQRLGFEVTSHKLVYMLASAPEAPREEEAHAAR